MPLLVYLILILTFIRNGIRMCLLIVVDIVLGVISDFCCIMKRKRYLVRVSNERTSRKPCGKFGGNE